MRWLKILVVTCMMLILVIGIVLIIVIFTFDDDDYRSAFINLVQSRTDDTLTINGSFSVERSITPTLLLSNAQLRAADGSYEVHVGQFKAQLSIMPLLAGNLWLKELKLNNVNIHSRRIVRDEQAKPDSVLLPTFNGLIPILEQAQLQNITVHHTDENGVEQWQFDLHELLLGSTSEDDALHVSGAGVMLDYPFTISGQLGSVADLLETVHAYPIELQLQSNVLQASIIGKIGEPLQGRDIDLSVTANVPEFSVLAQHWKESPPPLGRLEASMRLHGSLSKTSVSDVIFRLAHPGEHELKVTGIIKRLQNLEGTYIQLSGSFEARNVLHWMLPASWPAFNRAELKGLLVKKKKALTLTDIDIQARSSDGLHVVVSGNGRLKKTWQRQLFSELDAKLQFTAPATAPARSLLYKKMPEMGPVIGELRMNAADQYLTFNDIKVTLGKETDTTMKIGGRIGRVPLIKGIPKSEIDLQFSVQANKTTTLGKLVDYKLPELGPVKATAQVTELKDGYQLSKIYIVTGKPGQSEIKTSGQLHLKKENEKFVVENSNLSLAFSASSMQKFGMQFDYKLPDIGPVAGTLQITGPQQLLGIRNIKIDAGKKGALKLVAVGDVRRLHILPTIKPEGLNLKLHALSPSTSVLEPYVGITLPRLGAMQASGVLISEGNKLALNDIEIQTGPDKATTLKAKGSVKDVLSGRGINIDTQFNANMTSLLEARVGKKLPNLGRARGSLKLIDADGSLGIESLDIKIARKGIFNVQIKGVVDDLKKMDIIGLQHDFVIDDFARFGAIFEKNWPAVAGPIRGNGKLSIDHTKAQFKGTVATGRSKAAILLDGSINGQRPNLKGSLTVPVLYVEDLIMQSHEQKQEKSQSTESTKTRDPLFSNEPLKLSVLKSFDLELQMHIDQVAGAQASLDKIDANLKLNAGHLQIRPLEFVFEGGKMNVILDFNTKDMPQAELIIVGDDIALGSTLSNFRESVPIDGNLNISTSLRSMGNSPHQLAKNLQGSSGIVIENARVPRKYLDLLFTDLLGWALTTAGASEQYTKISCSIVRFNYSEGVAKSETLLADGDYLSVSGQATINLGNETIDAVIYPQQKEKFWKTTSPVRISGSIVEPKVIALPLASAVQEYGTLLLAPQVVIGTRAIGKLRGLLEKDSDEGVSPCLDLEKKLQQAR